MSSSDEVPVRGIHVQGSPAIPGRPFSRDPIDVHGVGRRPSRADLTPVDPERVAAWQLAQDVAHATYLSEVSAREAESMTSLRGASVQDQAADVAARRWRP